MIIKITGCNNCPFRNSNSDCMLDKNLSLGLFIDVLKPKREEFNETIPENCPIKEGITIKPKQ